MELSGEARLGPSISLRDLYFFFSNPFNHHSIHHTVFYRPENLNKLFFDAGLEVVKSEVFHWRRYPTQKILEKLKGLLWWLISLSGQGLYIEAIYRKKG